MTTAEGVDAAVDGRGVSAEEQASAPSRRPGWFPWAAMGLVLAVALLFGVRPDNSPRTNEERAFHLANSLKCPTCRSQSVAESEAPVAAEIRTNIARRIEQGQSDGEIRSYLVGRFGQDILLTPSASGFTGLVWVIPVVALILAVAGLTLAFRRWKERPVVEATDADRALVAQAQAHQDPTEPGPSAQDP